MRGLLSGFLFAIVLLFAILAVHIATGLIAAAITGASPDMWMYYATTGIRMFGFGALMCLFLSCLVAFDSHSNKVPLISEKPYSFNNGAGGWLMTQVICLILCFPAFIWSFLAYIFKRKKHMKEVEMFMKQHLAFANANECSHSRTSTISSSRLFTGASLCAFVIATIIMWAGLSLMAQSNTLRMMKLSEQFEQELEQLENDPYRIYQ